MNRATLGLPGLLTIAILLAACGSDSGGAADPGADAVESDNASSEVSAEVAPCPATECFIGGTCVEAGAAAPSDPCRVCDATKSAADWSPAADGTACTDGDPCTENDACSAGKCAGAPLSCDDDNPCTNDSCDGSGCHHLAQTGTCDDGDPCTVGDACDAGMCAPGKNTLVCDDKDPCTADTCEKGTGCTTSPLDGGTCEAGDPCKSGDTCVAGTCVEGTADTVCDDGTDCTEEHCDAKFGCVYTTRQGECDDGFECTIQDACVAGQCAGVLTWDCTPCTVTPNEDAQNLTGLGIGENGNPGNGLDLDGSAATCAPADQCSGGVDNQLGALAALVNPGLQQAIDDGVIHYLLSFTGANFDGAPFSLVFQAAEQSTVTLPKCDPMVAQCAFVPYSASFTPDCKPVVILDNAVVKGDLLTAGGPGYTFAVQAVLIGDTIATLGMRDARIEARVTKTVTGTAIERLDGVVGGAINKAEFVATIQGLPDAFFLSIGMNKEQVVGLLDIAVVADLDTDRDGTPESTSVGFRFNSIPADIVAL